MDEIQDSLKQKLVAFLSWHWFVRFVRWLIVSAGTVAESAFLLATLYVTICVVAHPLLTWILPTKTILVLNQVSVIVFACIPELIVLGAMRTTLDHWKTAIRTKGSWSLVWAIAYTIPTLVFLSMTIITILSFVSLQEINVNSYQVSGWNLSVRVLFGWIYGVIGMLFDTVGKQGYAETITDIRQEKDTIIAELHREIHVLSEMNKQKSLELSEQKQFLLETKNRNTQLIQAINRSTDTALEAYGQECINWVSSAKSASVDDICKYSGHSKQRVLWAIKRGDIRKSPGRGTTFTMASIEEWLKNVPPSPAKAESNTDPILPATNGHSNVTSPLNGFVEMQV